MLLLNLLRKGQGISRHFDYLIYPAYYAQSVDDFVTLPRNIKQVNTSLMLNIIKYDTILEFDYAGEHAFFNVKCIISYNLDVKSTKNRIR